MTDKPSKLGQTDLVFGLWSEFISRSVHAGYKYLRVTFMISVTLVDTQTRRQLLTDYTISSASRANKKLSYRRNNACRRLSRRSMSFKVCVKLWKSLHPSVLLIKRTMQGANTVGDGNGLGQWRIQGLGSSKRCAIVCVYPVLVCTFVRPSASSAAAAATTTTLNKGYSSF